MLQYLLEPLRVTFTCLHPVVVEFGSSVVLKQVALSVDLVVRGTRNGLECN